MATKRKDQAGQAVFPCVLKTIAVFNKKDPIILGVDIMEGSLRVGTPICAIKQEPESNIKQVLQLGKVTSLEVNHKSMDVIKKGQAWGGVAVKIEGSSQPLYGRHIDESDILYSHISRATIDTLKDPVFRQDVTNEEWKLIVQLKKTFDIN